MPLSLYVALLCSIHWYRTAVQIRGRSSTFSIRDQPAFSRSWSIPCGICLCHSCASHSLTAAVVFQEVWQYACGSTESGDVLDAYGIFKPVGRAAVQGSYSASPGEHETVFVGLPDSPRSLRSACSQQNICAKSDPLGSTPTSHKTSTPILPYCSTAGRSF